MSTAPIQALSTVQLSSVHLDDPTVRFIALALYAQRFDQIDPASLQEMQKDGFDPVTVDRIRSLSTSDLVRLARFTKKESIQITINTGNLVADMNRYEHLRQDEAMFEYFVRNGASLQLIMNLFSKRPTDIKRMQTMLGVVPQAGRRAIPDDPTRHLILSRWHELRKGHDWPYLARDHYKQMHVEFADWSISQIESVIATYHAYASSGNAVDMGTAANTSSSRSRSARA